MEAEILQSKRSMPAIRTLSCAFLLKKVPVLLPPHCPRLSRIRLRSQPAPRLCTAHGCAVPAWVA